jgi:hypothetical protein
VANFIARCMECQKVKNEYRHLVRFLHRLPIPEWKWEIVTIDFITKLLRITMKHSYHGNGGQAYERYTFYSSQDDT